MGKREIIDQIKTHRKFPLTKKNTKKYVFLQTMHTRVCVWEWKGAFKNNEEKWNKMATNTFLLLLIVF